MDTITKIDLSETTQGTNDARVSPQRVPLEDTTMTGKSKIMVPFVVVGIIAGIITGFLYAKQSLLIAGGTGAPQVVEADGNTKVGQVVGAQDESTYKDSAEGVVQPGGIGGEGSHHLVRGDNQSQWVYITSSVIDLDQFVGDKVTIWGETIQGKKAGWLMDVGRLKVLQLNAAEVNAIDESVE